MQTSRHPFEGGGCPLPYCGLLWLARSVLQALAAPGMKSQGILIVSMGEEGELVQRGRLRGEAGQTLTQCLWGW